MVGKTIKYKTRSGEEFDGYLTKPEINDPLPGIVIIPAIFGTDDDMIQLSDAWASDGFIVSVPDIFWRVLPGPTADSKRQPPGHQKTSPHSEKPSGLGDRENGTPRHRPRRR